MGHLAWGLRGSGQPPRGMWKQGGTHQRPQLGWESTDLKFSCHQLPCGPLPSRVSGNWAAKDITMETRGAWIQWMSLSEWISNPYHPCHHSAVFSSLLDPIQCPVENKHKEGRRQIEGENVETVADFIFLGSKVIVNGDCSQEIKRRFLHGRKAVTNLDSILKSKVITLPTKIRIVKL